MGPNRQRDSRAEDGALVVSLIAQAPGRGIGDRPRNVDLVRIADCRRVRNLAVPQAGQSLVEPPSARMPDAGHRHSQPARSPPVFWPPLDQSGNAHAPDIGLPQHDRIPVGNDPQGRRWGGF